MRVTRRGYGLLVAAALLLGAGFGYGYPELAALGVAALVAVAGAVAYVSWRPRLAVARQLDPDRVTRGESSQVRLSISNASRFFGASAVAQDRCGGRVVAVPLVRLRPGRVTQVSYPVPTARRGVYQVGPLEIIRTDPLALVGVARRFGEPATVWVRPRVHPIAAVPVGLSRSMDGRVDRVPQGSITFAALREYVVGDDLRHVHWRTSARVGELMVREHVDTSLPRVVVLLDDRVAAHASASTGGESSFEAACEAAASVLVAAVREDIRVELQFVAADGPAAAARGVSDVGPLLDRLAEVVLTEATGDVLRSAIERLRVRRVGDTLLFLTGPGPAPAAAAGLQPAELGLVAGLRGAYPSIISTVFGADSALTTTAGMLVVGATDGADFAAAWDGIRAW